MLFAKPGLAGVQISALSNAWSPHLLIQQFNLSELLMRDLHQILHNL